jgi:hypothetical protein
MEMVERTHTLLRDTPVVRRAAPTLAASWHRLDRSHLLYESRCLVRHGRAKRFPVRLAVTPEMPRYFHGAYQLCVRLNVDLVSLEAADAVFHFADLTRRDELPSGLDARTINGRLRDISKRHVNEVHGRIFGYDLSPEAGSGEMIEKSDDNAAHDGHVVDHPSGRPGVVTQRLVDNRLTDHVVVDHRVCVMDGRIVYDIIRHRPVDDRFRHVSANRLALIVEPSGEFSEVELGQLVAMAEAMGADWADLDVLRDRNSGRVYVVDVNGTPAAPSDGLRDLELAAYWRLQEQGFADLLRNHAR